MRHNRERFLSEQQSTEKSISQTYTSPRSNTINAIIQPWQVKQKDQVNYILVGTSYQQRLAFSNKLDIKNSKSSIPSQNHRICRALEIPQFGQQKMDKVQIKQRKIHKVNLIDTPTFQIQIVVQQFSQHCAGFIMVIQQEQLRSLYQKQSNQNLQHFLKGYCRLYNIQQKLIKQPRLFITASSSVYTNLRYHPKLYPLLRQIIKQINDEVQNYIARQSQIVSDTQEDVYSQLIPNHLFLYDVSNHDYSIQKLRIEIAKGNFNIGKQDSLVKMQLKPKSHINSSHKKNQIEIYIEQQKMIDNNIKIQNKNNNKNTKNNNRVAPSAITNDDNKQRIKNSSGPQKQINNSNNKKKKNTQQQVQRNNSGCCYSCKIF